MMWPLCAVPRMLPAPRISRSRMAIRKPAPNELYCLIALIRAIDDDRVCIRNIETAFDNRRANEHVRFPGDEPRHHRFEFVGVHLAVPDFNSGLRTKMHDPIAHTLDARDAVVQKEHLALPF